MKTDLFISVDIETDGPIPGPHSMLSLGAAAIHNYEIVSTFEVNLEPLPGATMDPRTKKEFWDKNPEAWAACQKNPVPPAKGMAQLTNWVSSLEGKHGKRPTFVAYPAGFDFSFVYWYLIKFMGNSVFSFSALDMKTLGMALLHKPGSKAHSYRSIGKRRMPKEWFSSRPHTHIALDDALEQADLFISMLKALDENNLTVELDASCSRYVLDKNTLANTLENLQVLLNESEI